MTQKATKQAKENAENLLIGKVFSGTVTSDKMKDTMVVAIARYVKHPKYKKYIRRMKKYHVHDPGNVHHTGDKVQIRECRPISKTKHFTVV